MERNNQRQDNTRSQAYFAKPDVVGYKSCFKMMPIDENYELPKLDGCQRDKGEEAKKGKGKGKGKGI